MKCEIEIHNCFLFLYFRAQEDLSSKEIIARIIASVRSISKKCLLWDMKVVFEEGHVPKEKLNPDDIIDAYLLLKACGLREQLVVGENSIVPILRTMYDMYPDYSESNRKILYDLAEATAPSLGKGGQNVYYNI